MNFIRLIPDSRPKEYSRWIYKERHFLHFFVVVFYLGGNQLQSSASPIYGLTVPGFDKMRIRSPAGLEDKTSLVSISKMSQV